MSVLNKLEHDLKIGDIVLIGKSWNYEAFANLKIHYLVYKDKGIDDEDAFTAVALELGLFATSHNVDSAKEDLQAIIHDYISKEQVSVNTIDRYLERTEMDSFWVLYRRLSFLLGDPEVKHNHKLEKEVDGLRQEVADEREKNAELKVDFEILKQTFQNNRKFTEDDALNQKA